MPRVQVWIDIPEGMELACDEMRIPKRGDWFISASNGQILVAEDDCYDSPRVIIRKSWKWPEWLTARYVFLTEHGDWIASNEKPNCAGCSGWHWSGGSVRLSMTTFKAPECNSWRTSLRENPNWKPSNAG